MAEFTLLNKKKMSQRFENNCFFIRFTLEQQCLDGICFLCSFLQCITAGLYRGHCMHQFVGFLKFCESSAQLNKTFFSGDLFQSQPHEQTQSQCRRFTSSSVWWKCSADPTILPMQLVGNCTINSVLFLLDAALLGLDKLPKGLGCFASDMNIFFCQHLEQCFTYIITSQFMYTSYSSLLYDGAF